jgi:hypothetical protein
MINCLAILYEVPPNVCVEYKGIMCRYSASVRPHVCLRI